MLFQVLFRRYDKLDGKKFKALMRSIYAIKRMYQQKLVPSVLKTADDGPDQASLFTWPSVTCKSRIFQLLQIMRFVVINLDTIWLNSNESGIGEGSYQLLK